MGTFIVWLIGLVIYGSAQAQVDFNYTKCNGAICFGLPENCLSTANCSVLATVVKLNSEVYQFEVQTITVPGEEIPQYVAVGLSLDSRMEDDSVVECVQVNGRIEVFMSYTQRSPTTAARHNYTDEITVVDASYIDGSIYCKFERKASTVIHSQTFDLNVTPYHLLVSKGPQVEENALIRHSHRLPSPEPLIVPDVPETPNQNIDYDSCGITQTCFGIPSGCEGSQNCHTVVAFTHVSSNYRLQMVTSSGQAYFAVGLSFDQLMGNDSVVECVRENDSVTMYTSLTRTDHSGTDRQPSGGVATLLDSSYVNGRIYCLVDRTPQANVSNLFFDLDLQTFFIFLAIGDETTVTSITRHRQRQISNAPILLGDIVNVSQAEKPLLIKLHGCFMIFAWIGTASIGLVLARYFKQEWSNNQIFGKDLWYIFHMICMITTWSLTMCGFIMIFVHVGGWTKSGTSHGILGIIVTILCFFQPIGAVFRPHPKHPKRYIFNIGHYFCGRAAYILAIVNIFYAIFLTSAEIPIWFLGIMVLFVVVFWGNHIIMGIMLYLTDSNRPLFRAFIGPTKKIDYATADYSAWYVRLKMKLLLTYVVAVCIFVMAGILVVTLVRDQ